MGYDEWQEAHPTHAIIMKMGFFYSALRYAAEVVSYCTGYRLGTWTNGIKITGAPNTDRIGDSSFGKYLLTMDYYDIYGNEYIQEASFTMNGEGYYLDTGSKQVLLKY